MKRSLKDMLPSKTTEIPLTEMEINKRRMPPAMNVINFMKVISGSDILKIYGLSELSALSILGETGNDRRMKSKGG